MKHFHDFIITTERKSRLLKNRDAYSGEEYEKLFWEATQSQAAAYRKQFKIAAKACEIRYPVSTHSTRKTFGYWAVKLHPYDVTTIDKLQGIFSHTDRNTTLHYIGIAREDEVKIYEDNGAFIKDVIDGKKPAVKNSPVISLKAEDFRELLGRCWDMARTGEDKFEGISQLISAVEKKMV